MLMLMSAVETGQMSAAESQTGQMSAAETRQMSTIETTGRSPFSIVYIARVPFW